MLLVVLLLQVRREFTVLLKVVCRRASCAGEEANTEEMRKKSVAKAKSECQSSWREEGVREFSILETKSSGSESMRGILGWRGYPLGPFILRRPEAHVVFSTKKFLGWQRVDHTTDSREVVTERK